MKLAPSDISYLRERAASTGYNADDLLKVINYESSGRPDVWGGKGNNYFGLIQFGPDERKKFGVDTVHPNAQNQIDAAFRFLDARGFKPGMGLMDMYSTVLAGSPGHYNRSDGAGTVASHVANMGGQPQPATPVATGGLIGLRAAAESMPAESDAARLDKLIQSISGAAGGSPTSKRVSVPEESVEQAAPIVRHLEFKGYRPKPKKVAGLLGM